MASAKEAVIIVDESDDDLDLTDTSISFNTTHGESFKPVFISCYVDTFNSIIHLYTEKCDWNTANLNNQ